MQSLPFLSITFKLLQTYTTKMTTAGLSRWEAERRRAVNESSKVAEVVAGAVVVVAVVAIVATLKNVRNGGSVQAAFLESQRSPMRLCTVSSVTRGGKSKEIQTTSRLPRARLRWLKRSKDRLPGSMSRKQKDSKRRNLAFQSQTQLVLPLLQSSQTKCQLLSQITIVARDHSRMVNC